MAAMALISRQTGPIAVYGATGYTGRLVVAELTAADLDFVVSGRNPTKLEALREELSLDAPAVTARVDDPASLRALLADSPVLINCAGPFVRFGEPVLAAAVETGTHYLDTTGEQPFMKMAYERYGPGAARSGVAVVPAMGFDYVPGDMLASLTAGGMGELDEVSMNYSWQNFSPARGPPEPPSRSSAATTSSGGRWSGWRRVEASRAGPTSSRLPWVATGCSAIPRGSRSPCRATFPPGTSGPR